MDALKGLFDEKMMKITSLFVNRPEHQFYLSEIANLTKVNISSTFRIVQKLAEQNVITVTEVGKTKLYRMGFGERSIAVATLLTKSTKKDPLETFIGLIKNETNVSKIILETKTVRKAKLILVSKKIKANKLEPLVEKISSSSNFTIEIAEISEAQFASLRLFKGLSLEEKIIWDRQKQ